MKILTRSNTDRPQKIERVVKSEVTETSKSKRTMVSVVTNDALDRYREIIVPKGIKLDNYRANPIVLWCHMQSQPIGKALWIKRYTKDGRSGLLAKTLFANNDLAEEIFQLYADEFLNGWSIGACPDWSKYSPPTEEEIKANPDYKKARALIRSCELCEYSACSVPANPEALGNDQELEKRASDLILKAIKESPQWSDLIDNFDADENDRAQAELIKSLPALPPTLPPLVGRTFAEVLAETQAAVLRLTGPQAVEKTVTETLDRLKGRV